MGNYIPDTKEERREMLERVGVKSVDDLYVMVPEEVRKEDFDLPEGRSEMEVRELLEKMA
ncbi:MAG: hypothetical protein IIZ33_08955, partial [Erysipelotrichaceae bacterium]|nr:hypothetical protein [Erysipelotrichaceae bacterium]